MRRPTSHLPAGGLISFSGGTTPISNANQVASGISLVRLIHSWNEMLRMAISMIPKVLPGYGFGDDSAACFHAPTIEVGLP